jgi:hypothetical protein
MSVAAAILLMALQMSTHAPIIREPTVCADQRSATSSMIRFHTPRGRPSPFTAAGGASNTECKKRGQLPLFGH